MNYEILFVLRTETLTMTDTFQLKTSLRLILKDQFGELAKLKSRIRLHFLKLGVLTLISSQRKRQTTVSLMSSSLKLLDGSRRPDPEPRETPESAEEPARTTEL